MMDNKKLPLYLSIGILLGIIIFHRFLSIVSLNIFLFLDNFLELSANIHPAILWGFLGLLVGLIYGAIVAWKKFTIDFKLILLPVGLLMLVSILFLLINAPLNRGVWMGINAPLYDTAARTRIDSTNYSNPSKHKSTYPKKSGSDYKPSTNALTTENPAHITTSSNEPRIDMSNKPKATPGYPRPQDYLSALVGSDHCGSPCPSVDVIKDFSFSIITKENKVHITFVIDGSKCDCYVNLKLDEAENKYIINSACTE